MEEELKTILCKNIISEDLTTFKNQISQYGFLNSGLTLNDTLYQFTQAILLTQYGNSYIRYETAENFLNALSLRFNNVAPVYAKKFAILADALDIENSYFISNVKEFTENKNNTLTTNQTEKRKDAETPTAVKASTDFVDKFTNSQSKTENNGTSQEYAKITHQQFNTNELIDRIEKLNRYRSMLFEAYAKEYNDLFIQFL